MCSLYYASLSFYQRLIDWLITFKPPISRARSDPPVKMELFGEMVTRSKEST